MNLDEIVIYPQQVPYLPCLSLKRKQLLFPDNFPFKLKTGLNDMVLFTSIIPSAVYVKVVGRSSAKGVPPNTVLLVHIEDNKLNLLFLDKKKNNVYVI